MVVEKGKENEQIKILYMVPSRDQSGKFHSPKGESLPDHVPDEWTRDDLEHARDELRESIKRRNEVAAQKGEEAKHRDRIRREEQLLRQVEKKLSGS